MSEVKVERVSSDRGTVDFFVGRHGVHGYVSACELYRYVYLASKGPLTPAEARAFAAAIIAVADAVEREGR